MEIDVKLLVDLDADQLLERLAQEGWPASRDPEDYRHSFPGVTSCERIQGQLKTVSVSPDDDFDLDVIRHISITYLEHQGHKRIVSVFGQEYYSDLWDVNPFAEISFQRGYSYHYKLGEIVVHSTKKDAHPTPANGYNTQLTMHYVTQVSFLDEMQVQNYKLEF